VNGKQGQVDSSNFRSQNDGVCCIAVIGQNILHRSGANSPQMLFLSVVLIMTLVRSKLYARVTFSKGRAVAQAVSGWLPTAAARVRFRAACGVCGRQSGTGPGFPRVFRFPLPIIPPISPSS
jgi:hypothetical protein